MMMLNTEGLEKKINKQGKTVYFIDYTGSTVWQLSSGERLLWRQYKVTEVTVQDESLL